MIDFQFRWFRDQIVKGIVQQFDILFTLEHQVLVISNLFRIFKDIMGILIEPVNTELF